LGCTLDGSIENLGRGVLCAYITTYCNGVTTNSLYLVDNRLGLLLVETRFVKHVAPEHAIRNFTCTYSLTTTFAPSLAKRMAALRPIPYESREIVTVKEDNSVDG
jgi:hypothetical protein